MAPQLKFAVLLTFVLFVSSSVFAQNEWHPMANGAGLFFKTEYLNGSQPTCVVRLREDKKLRRTASEIAVTYLFQQAKRSRNYAAHFEARDTDTLYLGSCEQVVNVVATKVQRW